MLENKSDLVIKYLYDPANGVFFLLLTLLFSIIAYFSYPAQEADLFLASVVLALLMFLFGLGQFRFRKKDFYIKGDKRKNTFEVNVGTRNKKNPVLQLSKFHSFAFQITTGRKSGTFYSIQIATDPKTWCDYYHKSEQKRQKYIAGYKEMYLVFNFSSQQEDDAYQLIEFLEICDIKEKNFTPSVLGSYPGVPKKNHAKAQLTSKKKSLNSVERKMMIKQWLSYAFWIFFFSLSILYIFFEFFGALHGIYW